MSKSFHAKYGGNVEKLIKDIPTYQKALQIYKEYELDPSRGFHIIYNRDEPEKIKTFNIRPLYKTTRKVIKDNIETYIPAYKYELLGDLATHWHEQTLIKIFPATEENIRLFNQAVIEYYKETYLGFVGELYLSKSIAPFIPNRYENLLSELNERLKQSIENGYTTKPEFLKTELDELDRMKKENMDLVKPRVLSQDRIGRVSLPRLESDRPTFKSVLAELKTSRKTILDKRSPINPGEDRLDEYLVYREYALLYCEVQSQLRGDQGQNKKSLTHHQIALIYRYENWPITANNAESIALDNGHKSGKTLFDYYNKMNTPSQRTAKAKNTLKAFERIIPLLTDAAKKLALSEFNTAKIKNS